MTNNFFGFEVVEDVYIVESLCGIRTDIPGWGASKLHYPKGDVLVPSVFGQKVILVHESLDESLGEEEYEDVAVPALLVWLDSMYRDEHGYPIFEQWAIPLASLGEFLSAGHYLSEEEREIVQKAWDDFQNLDR